MTRLLKYMFIFSCFIFSIYSLVTIFGIDTTIFKTINVNGQYILTFDMYSYLNNFNNSFSSFQETISELGANHYNWSDFISSIKSLANVMITVVNALLIPFSLVGSLLNVVCAFIGLPLNNSNPLYTIFNGIAGMQIPYIPVD